MTITDKAAALARLEQVHTEWRAAAGATESARENRAYAMGDAYRAGATLAEIGATIGVGHSAIHHAMRRAGLDPEELRGGRPVASALVGNDPR